MTNNSEYKVKLEMFEGPMDLLLHLIRKNEVDIFDIPVALITDQYLEYMDLMSALSINVAGDFLVMASTLVHLKSRMLLPEFGEGEENDDPREELTRPLLEYLSLKEAAGDLFDREMLDRDVFTRTIPADYKSQFKGEETLLDVNLFQLMDAFKRIIEEELPGAAINIETEQWTVEEKSALILEHLREKKSIMFRELFKNDRTINEFIITFLALLEMVHMALVRIYQPDPYKDIRLELFNKDNGDIDNE